MTSRAEAARIALLGQGVVIAGLLVTIAVIMLWPDQRASLRPVSLDRIDDRAGDKVDQIRAATASTTPGSGEAAFEPDLIGIADRLKLAGRIRDPEPEKPITQAVNPREVAVETPDAETEAETEIAAPAEARSRYLGLVRAGSLSWGLLAVEDSQGMVRVGAKRTFAGSETGSETGNDTGLELELIEATETRAVVMEDGVRFELEKSAKSEAAFSVASAESPKPAGNGRTPANVVSREGRNAVVAAKGGTPNLPPRPRAEDFRDADGELDRDAYRKALREYSAAARSALSGGNLRSQGGRSGASNN